MSEETQPTEQAPVAPTKKTNPAAHWGVVILGVAAIFMATTFVLSLLNRNTQSEPVVEATPEEPMTDQETTPEDLTIEQRQQILDALVESSTSTEEVSFEERMQILDDLAQPSADSEEGAGAAAELTVEERMEILNSLSESPSVVDDSEESTPGAEPATSDSTEQMDDGAGM